MIGAAAVVDGLALALLAVALFSVTIRGLVGGVWLLVVQSLLLALVAATSTIPEGSAVALCSTRLKSGAPDAVNALVAGS